MLIELAVSNYRSIRDEQRLSLVAGREKIHRDANVFEPVQPSGGKRLRLLRSVGLYGPNASGKTNLVRALATIRRMVLTSQQQMTHLPVEPFLFDPATRSQPTLFEVMVMVEGVRYQYGFSATADRIHDEWLFAFPKGRAQRWFEREFFPDEGREEFTFGDRLTGDKEIWRRATRPNALFLSTAVQLNSRQLQPLFDWFRDRLRVISIDDGWDSNHSIEWCQDDKNRGNKQRILKFLQAADFAISDLRVEKLGYGREEVRLNTVQQINIALYRHGKRPEGPKYLPDYEHFPDSKVFLFHQGSNGQPIQLDMEDESDGTQKMFNLAAPWLDALEQGRILFVDELHDNLHPLLVQFLVRLFHAKETNPKGAQLIFTTHETSILSDEYQRRDQIWFCKRDRDQATQLYPLTRFRPPKGAENLTQDYLVGCYGAVPFVDDPSEAFGN